MAADTDAVPEKACQQERRRPALLVPAASPKAAHHALKTLNTLPMLQPMNATR